MSEIFAQTNLVGAMKVWEGERRRVMSELSGGHMGLIIRSSVLLHIVKFSTMKRRFSIQAMSSVIPVIHLRPERAQL